MNVGIDLSGRKAVIFGVATNRSIAWSIAKTLDSLGCRVALGFQERMRGCVEKVAKELKDPVLIPCDVLEDSQIEGFFSKVEREFGSFDYLIHSIAFAPKEFLQGKYFNVTRAGFNTAMEVSVYSLPALVGSASRLLNDDGRVIAMSYLGSVRTVSNYNVMGVAKAALESSVRYLAADVGERGITVNGISAGPIKTLASSGITDFGRIREVVEERAPLKRNIEAEDVGNTALFLCSDLARNITGQVIYVDAGFGTVAV